MNKKISELEEADSIEDEDLMMIVQKNKNMKIPYKKMQQIDTASLTIPKNITTNEVTTATTLTNNYTITLPLQYQCGNNSLQILLCRTSTKQGCRIHRSRNSRNIEQSNKAIARRRLDTITRHHNHSNSARSRTSNARK